MGRSEYYLPFKLITSLKNRLRWQNPKSNIKSSFNCKIICFPANFFKKFWLCIRSQQARASESPLLRSVAVPSRRARSVEHTNSVHTRPINLSRARTHSPSLPALPANACVQCCPCGVISYNFWPPPGAAFNCFAERDVAFSSHTHMHMADRSLEQRDALAHQFAPRWHRWH